MQQTVELDEAYEVDNVPVSALLSVERKNKYGSHFSGVAVGISYSSYCLVSQYFLKLSKHVVSCCRNLGEREMLDCQIYFTV
jgi:hypothetical protein